MKCVRCDKDANKKARGGRSRCPACGHRFASDPKRDRVTDRLVHNAAQAVSGNGVLHFLPAHLRYEIDRRRLRLARKSRRWGVAFLVLAGVCLLLGFQHSEGWVVAFVILLIVAATRFGSAYARKQVTRPTTELVSRWLRFNPDDMLLPDSAPTAAPPRPPEDEPDLGEVSFDHVLVCDRKEYVDFFLANLFHFHYSCPVLGGDGYPPAVFPDMIRRLKENPELKVYLLHDLTPAGLHFVERVKQSKRWFGDMPGLQIVDLGLSPPQKRLFEKMLTPLARIPGAHVRGVEVPDLPPGQGAELPVLRPDDLIRMCGRSLGQGQPFQSGRSGAGFGVGVGFGISYGSEGGYG